MTFHVNPMHTLRRLLASAALATMAALAIPAVAPAAEISFDSGTLTYSGSAGEANFPLLYASSRGISITDFGASNIAITTEGCHTAGQNQVHCDIPATLRLHLGDAADEVDFGSDFPASVAVEIHGGPGADQLESSERTANSIAMDGGEGDDRLRGFGFDDRMHGGPGDDVLDGGAGDDVLEGGDGADSLRGDPRGAQPGRDVLDGGPGVDAVSDWDDPQGVRPPVSVTLNGVADDGAPGEGDDVRAVEQLTTTSSGTFELSDGDEYVRIDAASDEGPSVVRAHGGADVVIGYVGNETFEGGAGADTLEGGYGNDTLTGGPGPDEVFGDSRNPQCGYGADCIPPFGNDVIDVRDGERDTVDCGVGTDRVVADAADVLANCETIELPAAGGGGGSGGDHADRGPAAAKLRVERRRLAVALRRGLPIRLRGATPGRVTVVARVKRRVVGRGTIRVGKAGTGKGVLRFTRSGRRALRRASRVTLKVSAGSARVTVSLRR